MSKGKTFVDRARILARAGVGGDGCASFFRDTKVEFGPPDGGKGGDGGDVVLRASHNVSDLKLPTPTVAATKGRAGRGDGMDGRRGERALVLVPCGTDVSLLGPPTLLTPPALYSKAWANVPREPIAELLRDGDEVVVARGGRGGRGNVALRSRQLQSSRLAEDGLPGEQAVVEMRLRMIADVGLVGFPNAGKSSLLAAISRATPEVAAYPFTTLHPQLGVVHPRPEASFTVADIPGLLDGAHANRGLGHAFLSHVERTSLLCYVLDLAADVHPIAQLAALRRELDLYLPGLSARRCVVVGNKADQPDVAERLKHLRADVALRAAAGDMPGLVEPKPGASRVTAVSAAERRNLDVVVQRLHEALALDEAAEFGGDNAANAEIVV